jgi:hypothetical protein
MSRVDAELNFYPPNVRPKGLADAAARRSVLVTGAEGRDLITEAMQLSIERIGLTRTIQYREWARGIKRVTRNKQGGYYHNRAAKLKKILEGLAGWATIGDNMAILPINTGRQDQIRNECKKGHFKTSQRERDLAISLPNDVRLHIQDRGELRNPVGQCRLNF